jgi:hypothetical protein
MKRTPAGSELRACNARRPVNYGTMRLRPRSRKEPLAVAKRFERHAAQTIGQ